MLSSFHGGTEILEERLASHSGLESSLRLSMLERGAKVRSCKGAGHILDALLLSFLISNNFGVAEEAHLSREKSLIALVAWLAEQGCLSSF